MNIKEIIRLPDPRKNVKAELREVVRDVDKNPQVFVRVRLTGWHFPERAPEPFMMIGDAVSKFVLIENEGAAADAYFDVTPPSARRVSFGYGKTLSWDFDVSIDPAGITPLDRARLPRNIIDKL